MTNKQEDTSTEDKTLSVEELDAKLKEMPDDLGIV